MILTSINWFTTSMPTDPDINRSKPQYDYIELRFYWKVCYLFAKDYITHDKQDAQECVFEYKNFCYNQQLLDTWTGADLVLHHHQIIKDYDTWRYVHNGANPEN